MYWSYNCQHTQNSKKLILFFLLTCMNGLQVAGIGLFVTLTLLASTSNLKKKRIKMYKERYNQALRSGDKQRILAVGKDYYKSQQSQPSDDASIETAILKDIQTFQSTHI